MESCCHGIPPGAAHTYQAECDSLWRAGARACPDAPEAGVRRYLAQRAEQAQREGRALPRLKFLVEDLPAWLDSLASPKSETATARTMSELSDAQKADRDAFMRGE